MGECVRPALEAPEVGRLKWRPRNLPLSEWGELLARLRPVGLGIAEGVCGPLAYRFVKDRWWPTDPKDREWRGDPAELQEWLRRLVERSPLPDVEGDTFGRLCAGLKLPLWQPLRVWQSRCARGGL